MKYISHWASRWQKSESHCVRICFHRWEYPLLYPILAHLHLTRLITIFPRLLIMEVFINYTGISSMGFRILLCPNQKCVPASKWYISCMFVWVFDPYFDILVIIISPELVNSFSPFVLGEFLGLCMVLDCFVGIQGSLPQRLLVVASLYFSCLFSEGFSWGWNLFITDKRMCQFGEKVCYPRMHVILSRIKIVLNVPPRSYLGALDTIMFILFVFLY